MKYSSCFGCDHRTKPQINLDKKGRTGSTTSWTAGEILLCKCYY